MNDVVVAVLVDVLVHVLVLVDVSVVVVGLPSGGYAFNCQ